MVFTTSAGVHGPTLAEFAMFGVLAGAKDLPRLQAQQAQRQWTGRWAMKQVHEQTVLVAGLGGIGKQTARLAKAFGAYVIGTKRRPTPVENVDEVHPTGKLAELVGRADAIVFTLPGTASTNGLYNADLIAATKPGAVIVNVGRGSVIDEPGLIAGLESGRSGFGVPGRLRGRTAAQGITVVGDAAGGHRAAHGGSEPARGPAHRRTVRRESAPIDQRRTADQRRRHHPLLLSGSIRVPLDTAVTGEQGRCCWKPAAWGWWTPPERRAT